MNCSPDLDGSVAPICRGWAALVRLIVDHVCTGASTAIRTGCPECGAQVAQTWVRATDGTYCLQIRRLTKCEGIVRFEAEDA